MSDECVCGHWIVNHSSMGCALCNCHLNPYEATKAGIQQDIEDERDALRKKLDKARSKIINLGHTFNVPVHDILAEIEKEGD